MYDGSGDGARDFLFATPVVTYDVVIIKVMNVHHTLKTHIYTTLLDGQNLSSSKILADLPPDREC